MQFELRLFFYFQNSLELSMPSFKTFYVLIHIFSFPNVLQNLSQVEILLFSVDSLCKLLYIILYPGQSVCYLTL